MAQGVHQSHLIRNPTLSANESPVQICTAGPLGHLEFRKWLFYKKKVYNNCRFSIKVPAVVL